MHKRFPLKRTIFCIALFLIAAPFLPWPKAQQAIPTSTQSIPYATHKNRADFEKTLLKLFPPGTSQDIVHRSITMDRQTFSSDNLIKGTLKGQYRRGTSSDENYVFYYRPTKPSGENGWEHTSSGWVVRATYIGQKNLKTLSVLSTPADPDNQAAYPPIQLAKDLLDYKAEKIATSRFDNTEWQSLVHEQAEMPCLRDMTTHCFIKQSLQLLDLEKQKDNSPLFITLGDITIQTGSQDAARTLLSNWPSDNDVHNSVQSIPQFRRPSTEQTQARIAQLDTRKAQILALSGDIDAAKNIMIRHKDTGDDLGVIHALLQVNDLKNAFEISKMTLDWTRTTPDPNRGSSAIMHCNVYANPPRRPKSMGVLAKKFIENGQIENAEMTLDMIRTYWTNDAFGQESFCYSSMARSAYIYGMMALADYYSKNGSPEKVKGLIKATTETIIRQMKSFYLDAPGVMLDFSIFAHKNGESDSIRALANHIQQSVNQSKRKSLSYSDGNFTAALLALVDNIDDVSNFVENTNYQPGEEEKSDMLSSLLIKKNDEIIIKTYLRIIDVLKKIGEQEKAAKYAEKLLPFISRAQPKEAYQELDKLSNLAKIGLVFSDAKMKNRARETTDILMQSIKNNEDHSLDSNGRYKEVYNLINNLTHNRLTPEQNEAWKKKFKTVLAEQKPHNTIEYKIINARTQNDVNDALNQIKKFIETAQINDIRQEGFSYLLLKNGHDEAFFELIDFMGTLKKNPPPKTTNINIVPDPDTGAQKVMLQKLIIYRMDAMNISDENVKRAWQRYIKNGPYNTYGFYGIDSNNPTAKESMAANYLSLIKGRYAHDDLRRMMGTKN